MTSPGRPLRAAIPNFDRRLSEEERRVCCIGTGDLGGKAQGLVMMQDVLAAESWAQEFPEIDVSIPAMTVICTDIFDCFMQQNDLFELAASDLPDERIAHAFQKADLPFEVLGDLRALIAGIHTPLAVRSSSVLEDSAYEPFAGVFVTKMTPNNQHDVDARFRKLVEAIKFVYASTYFQSSKDYMKATGHNLEDEKMAVIIQEVVGIKHGCRYYPELSGVARSYNYYPLGPAKHQDGVVNLALGLGKTIVEGDVSWSYSPVYPKVPPPYGSVEEMVQCSQTYFWVVNMGEPAVYDPIQETEYLMRETLSKADGDCTLRHIASTYDAQSDRLVMGVGSKGARVLTFAPVLRLADPPLNRLVKKLLTVCESVIHAPVEIEFAMTFDPHRFSFLQVRQMAVSSDIIDVPEKSLTSAGILTASRTTLGNGVAENIMDIVYAVPDSFNPQHTQKMALELDEMNKKLLKEQRPYLLVVFGRLGSSDPWLGIPVRWSQISGARVIVEAAKENINVEMSQGSHYFHNLTNLGVIYFSVPYLHEFSVDWNWLDAQTVIEEGKFVRHVRIDNPLKVKVDGRSGRGVINKPAN
jgi:hypothetical protein